MTYHPFQKLPPPTPDPIFAVTAQAVAAGPDAINGTIGVFMEEDGSVAVFPSVKRAMDDLAGELPDKTFGYPKLPGLPEFRESVSGLMFEPGTLSADFATTGGTGAVALNLRLISLMQSSPKIILPVPAWANHMPVCKAAGFNVVQVPYVSKEMRPQIDDLLNMINGMDGEFSLLLQVGCHNPTGLDFSSEQWRSLASAIKKKQAIALLDFAYQGFAADPGDDAAPLRLFVREGIPALVSWSASKNHSIYGLRCGMASAVVADEPMRQVVEGHYSTLSRGLYSAAPIFGQMIVSRVQKEYKDQWLQDLKNTRSILMKKRAAMIDALPPAFKNSLDGNGMFAMLPLSAGQIERLKTEHKVFLTGDARINIAGIPMAKIEALARAIAAVA